MAEMEEALLIRVKTDGTLDVEKLTVSLKKLGDTADSAGSRGSQGMTHMSGAVGALRGEMLRALGPITTVAGAIFTLFKAIGNADSMRDLEASLRAVSSSGQSAAKAMAFFEEAQKRTRLTGDELTKLYGELLPLAIKRGFSEEQFQNITLQLSQFATATGKSVGEIQAAFQQIMTVKARAQNPILVALGMTPENLAQGEAGTKKLMEGIARLAREGENMGDSFVSAGKKISDALLDAFGEGFNEARGQVNTGVKGIVDVLTGPEILGAIRTIGTVVANILPPIAKVVSGAVALVQAGVGGFKYIVAGMLSFVVEGLEKIFGTMAKAARFVGLEGVANVLQSAADAMLHYKDALKDVSASGAEGAMNGLEKLGQVLGIVESNTTSVRKETEAATVAFGNLTGKVNESYKAYAKYLQLIGFNRSQIPSESQYGGHTGGQILDMRTGDPNAEFNSRVGELLDRQEAIFREGGAEIAKAGIVAGQNFVEEIRRQTDQLERAFTETFKEPMKDALLDMALSGGQAFGDIAGEALVNALAKSADTLTNSIADSVLQAFGADTSGQKQDESDQDYERRRRRNAQQAQKIGEVFELAVGGIGGIAANQSGQMNDTQTILSQTAIGASMGTAFFPGLGTVIGAVVGLLVGGISAALSSTGDNYPYATMGFEDGEAFFNPEQNISPAKAREALEQLQTVFDEFYSGYLKILLKFPLEVLPNFLDSMDIDPKIGKEIGGDFGRDASKMFWQDYEQYLAGGLPREIASRFKDTFQSAFKGMGMGEARFNEIWTDLQNMDPKAAMQNLSLLADAVIGFNKTMGFFGTQMNTTVGPGFHIEEGLMSQVAGDMNRSFGAQLQIDDQQLIRLGSALESLTGEHQIKAANELSSLMTERMEKEKAFLQSIIQGIENINRSFDASIRDLTLEGMVTAEGAPDHQAQVNFLMDYVEQLRQQMATATSPQEVQALSEEIRNNVLRIRQLGASAGGENDENYRTWAIDVLEQIRGEAVDRMNALAAEVEAANDAFMEAIQGFIDAFLGATAELTPDPEEPPPPGDTPDPDPDRPDYRFYNDSLSKQDMANSFLQAISEKELSVTINLTQQPGGGDFGTQVVYGRTTGL